MNHHADAAHTAVAEWLATEQATAVSFRRQIY